MILWLIMARERVAVLCILTLWASRSNGLTCYSCSYANTNTDAGAECLDQPWNVTTANTVKCSNPIDVCMVRGVYQKEFNRYQSFVRSCAHFVEECTGDVNWITCTTTCNTDMCNRDKLTIPGVGGEGGGGAASFTALSTLLAISAVIALISPNL